MKKLIYRLNSTSLRNRLMLAFVALIVTPLIIQGFLSLSILSSSVLDRYQSEMDYRFSQLEKEVDNLFVECRKVLFEFSYKKEIQEILQHKYEEEDFLRSRYIVEKLLLEEKINSGIEYSTFVYDLQGNCYSNDYLDQIPYTKVLKEEAMQDTHIYSTVMMTELMREYGYNKILMGRPIFDEKGRERIGTVVIRIDSKHIRWRFEDAFGDSGAKVTIMDDAGFVVAADELTAGSSVQLALRMEAPLMQQQVLERTNDILFTSEQDDRGWIYLAQINSDVIDETRWELQVTTYIMIAIVLVLAALVLFYITVDIVSPIKRLTESIEAFESAESAELTFKPKYNDEIGRLARSYNNMTYKLKESVEEIKRIEKEKQRAEVKMLEAQISPHFLYNTFSSIIWLIHKDKKAEATEMMEALAQLYRISLSRGREIISVREEFEHAESYLKIQGKRYRSDFSYELYMDPEISEYSVVKVVLQPLIENAIYHGVRLRTGDGKILVRGQLCDDESILLEVMDNGNMLGEDGCRKMNEALAGGGTQGIGVSNVLARLKLFYGGCCSMQYLVRDGFTVVEIRIPIRENETDV